MYMDCCYCCCTTTPTKPPVACRRSTARFWKIIEATIESNFQGSIEHCACGPGQSDGESIGKTPLSSCLISSSGASCRISAFHRNRGAPWLGSGEHGLILLQKLGYHSCKSRLRPFPSLTPSRHGFPLPPGNKVKVSSAERRQ